MRRWRLFVSAGAAGLLATGLLGAGGALWLANAANGQILNTISYGNSSTFAQPVFADGYLFTASQGPLGLQAYTVGGGAVRPR